MATQYSSASTTIPIVVVPGIMGSRLCDSDGTLIWNPAVPGVRMPGLFAAKTSRLRNIAPLKTPDDSDFSGYPIDRAAKATWCPGFYSMICAYYDDLCFALRDDLIKKLAERGHPELVPKVYGAGYDWRLSNAYSAEHYLKPVVERALADTKAQKVILVAHSMGGLVSRYYCKALNGESKVAAIFLVGSPSLGAVQPYTRLKQGIPDPTGIWHFEYDDFSTWALRNLLGLDQLGVRELLRLFPSMYELSANRIYTNKEQWLTFDEEDAGYAYLSDPAPAKWDLPKGIDAYKDIFVGHTELESFRYANLTLIERADVFHKQLSISDDKAYMHPTTYCVYCRNMDTQVLAHVKSYGTVENHNGANEYIGSWRVGNIVSPINYGTPLIEVTKGPGDSAVPYGSAHPKDFVNIEFAGEKEIRDVAHGSLPADTETAIPWIVDEISKLVTTAPS